MSFASRGFMIATGSRRAYVAGQRADLGRRSLAVLPVHYPHPLLTAFDVLAVELWGPPGPPAGDAAGRLQSYVCALARNALAFLAAGKADVVDGVLVPHTCDTLQGFASLIADFGGWEKKVFTFHHPRGIGRAAAMRALDAELRSLARRLEEWTGRKLELERLRRALALHHEIDVCRAALLDGRARLALRDVELYALLRRGEWLWPEDHLVELRAAVATLAAAPVQRGAPILVTGYVPEPAGLLEALEGAGAYVAADDYAAVGRRVRRAPPPSTDDDPFAALAAHTTAAPPCPTRGVDQGLRTRHLEALVARAGARGVLVHLQKFCEPELFDVPAIRRAFAARGVPVLVVEGELEAKLSAQTETRVEAFVEMLRAERRAS